jgi:hypothetical protein
MATIPTLPKLNAQEFKDFEKDLPKLLSVLNSFFSDVVSALSRRLNHSQNHAAVCREIEFTQRTSSYPLKFIWEFPNMRPSDVWITKLETISGTDPTASGMLWEFNDVDGVVQITTMFGLTTGSRYRLRVIAEAN